MAKYQLSDALKAELTNLWGDGSRMYNWHVGHLSNECMLDCGKIVTFDKPNIETSFCFGESDCGQGLELKEAEDMAEHARTSTEYFIEKNLAELKEYRDTLTGDEALYWLESYTGRDIVNIHTRRAINRWYCSSPNYDEIINNQELTANDRKKLLTVIDQEIAKFTKRLNTYLKRYGLSKIHSWTYWIDA